ncbi:acyl carrier protein [Candidatus Omnitrophota bacterium]
MNIIGELEKYLLTEVAAGLDKKSLAPDDDLLAQGIIDSMGIIKLLAFIEKTFGVKVNDEEMVPDNFQTLNAITELINKKKK